MTIIEKAIAHFQEASCKAKTMDELKFNNMVIKALRKQIPMLVYNKRTFWKYYHYCPKCGNLLDREGLKFCDTCGQRLDWSNYEEGLKYVRKTHN